MICVLCGQDGAASTEHVLAQWVTDWLPLGGEFTHHQSGDFQTDREWVHSSQPQITLKRICRTCNSGWLSDLEAAAAPLVGPLVAGRPSSLSRSKQTLVAAWAAKTMLLLGWRQPKQARPTPSLLRELFASRGHPENCQIWIGAYLIDGELMVHEWNSLVMEGAASSSTPSGMGYTSTLAVGRLLLHGFFSAHPDPLEMSLSRQSRRGLVPIWPARAGKLTWPPQAVFGRSDIAALARQFRAR